jgi:hypothetical protein
MGCAGSKKDVVISDLPPKEGHSNIQKSKPHGIEDEESHILNEGKSLNKTALDEITEKKITQNRPVEKPSTNNMGKESKEQSRPLQSENHSKSLYVDKKDPDSQPEEKKSLEASEVIAGKSKTFKLEFESHPHEFDFSFIEEQKLKEKKEKELLEEELLKEMSEIN